MAAKKRKKAPKKKKLKTIPQINRRLYKLWSEAVRGNVDFTCEVCGVKRSQTNAKGNPVKIDAHHFVSRYTTNSPFKFDIRNGIAVCPKCHKFGEMSFHNNPIATMEWARTHRLSDHDFILDHFDIKVDLRNRFVLAEIEAKLIAKEHLDFGALLDIAEANPRPCKKVKTPELDELDTLEGNLFSELDDLIAD